MKWFLTQAAIGQPEIDIREDDEDPIRGYALMRALAAMDEGEATHDEDLRRGFSLLAELAAEDGSRLEQIRPGLWMEPKDD